MTFDEYCAKKRQQYGSAFDTSALAPQFIEPFNNQKRISVRFARKETQRGRIGITTGWRPAFILMRRSSDMGSSLVLTDLDTFNYIGK